MSIAPDATPRLLPWLKAAAVGISIYPSGELVPEWWFVEVNNGLTGHSGAGSIIARCTTELEAELIACALWALERST